MLRFLLGFIMMAGSLAFLGCPLRMLIRMSAGDLNAYVGLLGFGAGVFTGTAALKLSLIHICAAECHFVSGDGAP